MKALATIFATLFLFASASFGEQQVHTLQKNETLYRLSRQYNVTVEAILTANNIDDPTTLKVGQKIIIPHSYLVKPGDTLYGIARKHNTTVDKLLRLNDLDEGYVLKVEDIILLPREGPVRTASAAETSDSGYPDTGNAPGEEDHGAAEQEVPKKSNVASPQTENDRAADRELDLQRELFWPVNGEIHPYEGKLSGTHIEGERGDPVVSISSGEVVWVGPYRGFGNVILIQSPDRFIYVYGGNEKTKVAVGETVNPGMEIGTLGIHPHGEKPVLFFTVFKDGKPVDPEKAPRI
jgi:murein DD-endopeptidase MepM/ murein hydrolase activator NlpD